MRNKSPDRLSSLFLWSNATRSFTFSHRALALVLFGVHFYCVFCLTLDSGFVAAISLRQHGVFLSFFFFFLVFNVLICQLFIYIVRKFAQMVHARIQKVFSEGGGGNFDNVYVSLF